MVRKYGSLLIFFLLSACIDPFELGQELQGDSLLVVDGKITNQEGPYQIALRYSSATLDGFESTAVAGAQVTITSQEGQQIILTEAETGVYYSDAAAIRGQAGNTYQLHITLPDGKRYASEPETMPPVTEIDSIYAVVERRTALSTLNTLIDRWGLEIYVNSGSNGTMPGFYRWEWEDTYQIAPALTLEPSSLPGACWLSSRGLRDINIASTQSLARDVVEKQPITFVSKRGLKLQVRYSILVRQYSLSSGAYTYWSRIKEQIEGAGSVFDPPPAQIAGNIYNVDDPNEVVLGYFQASSVAERRFFIRRTEVPTQPGGPVNAFPECQGVGAEPSPYCYDCSLVNEATTERPSFW